MDNLEKRIREVASKMEGKFMGTVPHSVFVEWDQTWTLFEGEDNAWHYSWSDDSLFVTPDSSDEEIEEAIRTWEDSHIDYYDEKIKEYEDTLENENA